MTAAATSTQEEVKPKRIQRKRIRGWTFLYHVGSCESAGTTPGTWREIKVIEVSYLCGCVALMTGKGANKTQAGELAPTRCPNCQREADILLELANQ